MAGLNLKDETIVANQSTGTETNLVGGIAKVWSSLNGTGTIAERKSLNVSSYVDNGTGDYTVTIANDMADNDYAFFVNSNYAEGFLDGTASIAAGYYIINTRNSSGSVNDADPAMSAAHGDLA